VTQLVQPQPSAGLALAELAEQAQSCVGVGGGFIYLHREWRNWVVMDWQRLARMRLKVGGGQAG
jgi:hypothetical protein